MVEYKFIYAVLIFYGFFGLLYSLNGGSLYGLSDTTIETTPPTDFLEWIVFGFGFFSNLFITPFINGSWALFGFINWAILGTMIYIAIRTIRGGG
jgi:hypothetical protein